MKRKQVMILAFGVLLFALFICWARTINIPVKSGGLVRLKPASFLKSIYSSGCTITYKTKQNREAKIYLLQTFWKWPIIVIPSTNADVLLCLYDNDTDVQLLRIDTNQGFRSLPRGRPLSRIVLASSCKVDEADEGDWDLAIKTMEQMTTDEFRRHSLPNFNFGILGIYGEPQDNNDRMKMHDAIMYNGDTTYPDPHQKGRWGRHPKP